MRAAGSVSTDDTDRRRASMIRSRQLLALELERESVGRRGAQVGAGDADL